MTRRVRPRAPGCRCAWSDILCLSKRTCSLERADVPASAVIRRLWVTQTIRNQLRSLREGPSQAPSSVTKHKGQGRRKHPLVLHQITIKPIGDVAKQLKSRTVYRLVRGLDLRSPREVSLNIKFTPPTVAGSARTPPSLHTVILPFTQKRCHTHDSPGYSRSSPSSTTLQTILARSVLPLKRRVSAPTNGETLPNQGL